MVSPSPVFFLIFLRFTYFFVLANTTITSTTTTTTTRNQPLQPTPKPLKMAMAAIAAAATVGATTVAGLAPGLKMRHISGLWYVFFFYFFFLFNVFLGPFKTSKWR